MISSVTDFYLIAFLNKVLQNYYNIFNLLQKRLKYYYFILNLPFKNGGSNAPVGRLNVKHGAYGGGNVGHVCQS